MSTAVVGARRARWGVPLPHALGPVTWLRPGAVTVGLRFDLVLLAGPVDEDWLVTGLASRVNPGGELVRWPTSRLRLARAIAVVCGHTFADMARLEPGPNTLRIADEVLAALPLAAAVVDPEGRL